MKRSIALLALVIAPWAAHANEADPHGLLDRAQPSTKSRSEVIADYDAARARGETAGPGELVMLARPAAASAKSRAQVAAELENARARGELAASRLPN